MLNRGTNTDTALARVSLSNDLTTVERLKERKVKHCKLAHVNELDQIYTFGEEIGHGSFGTVFSVTEKGKTKKWAVKIVSKNKVGVKMKFVEQEIHILKMVNHPHIIHLERVYETHANIYLVMEQCNAELARVFHKKRPFPEADVKKVVGEIVSAVVYLHKFDIVHRDLKLENILLADNPNDPSDKLYIKVSDFGLSVVKSGNGYQNMLHDCCGTLTYMPPEMITNYTYSQQCDVWSIGIITYLLLSGEFPFYGKTEKEVASDICKRDISFEHFPGSKESVNLLRRMLAKNPANRLTAAEIAEHPWLMGKRISDDASSPKTVLDMMHLWKHEMMVDTVGEESDWLMADPKRVSVSEAEDDVISKRTDAAASASKTQHDTHTIKRQSLSLAVKNIEFNRARAEATGRRASKRGGSTSVPHPKS